MFLSRIPHALFIIIAVVAVTLFLEQILDMKDDAKPYIRLQKGTEYFVAVSPAKYDYPDYAHSIVVLFERTAPEEWKKIGHQLLDPRWDTQGIAVIEDKLFLMHHNHKKTAPVTVHNINQFFEVAPEKKFDARPLATIRNIRNSVALESNNGGKICITFMSHGDTSRGIHIYDYDALMSGKNNPELTINLENIDGKGHSPSDCVFYKKNLIVSNHYRGDISILDISKTPPTIKRIPTGKDTGLYYPLGMAVHDDLLYVADHIHYYISVFDLSDLDNVRLVRTFGGINSGLQMPYHLAIYDNMLFAANLQPPQSISAYALDAKDSVTPRFVITKSKETLLNAPSDVHIFRY
ncbi:MAG: hypothetical protein ACK502_04050 [Alphaproteobacteria bacterium]